MTTPEQLREAQEARKEALLELAADRPAHLHFIQSLLMALDDDDVMDVVPPKGVSARVAEAILDDVFWIRQPPPPPGSFIAQYPNSYANRRGTDARAAHERERARERGGLGSLLGLGGEDNA